VRLVAAPRRQVDHIDIVFEAELAGAPALFLIEDKTETSHHSGQLKRYLEAVKHGQVVPIYFKTGYHFGADIAAADAKYTVIGLAEWVRFLKAQTVRNDIFEDYRAYVGEILEKRQAALAALMTPTGFIEAFEQDFVQFEFMQLLASACPEFVGRQLVYGGKSLGGDAWTQYLFAQFEGALPAGIKESLLPAGSAKGRLVPRCAPVCQGGRSRRGPRRKAKAAQHPSRTLQTGGCGICRN
jgi:hypothetical protein